MDTDLYYQPENPLLAGKDFSSRNLRALGALRGFAVNPELDFHREGAKHAKKTRRTLVWLRLCCSVVPFILLVAAGAGPCSSVSEPQDFIIVECENSFPALANDCSQRRRDGAEDRPPPEPPRGPPPKPPRLPWPYPPGAPRGGPLMIGLCRFRGGRVS